MKLLVVSDVHGNLEALNAVLERVRGWDEVAVLGDLVDYGPSPGEVLDAVKELEARVVRGNHDHAVAYGVDCQCGEETHWLSVWFRENVTLRLLGDGDRKWLAALSTRLTISLASVEAVAVHGAPRNPLYAYLYPWLGDDQVCSLLSRPPARLTVKDGGKCPEKGLYLVGHTHIQFHRVVRGST